MATEIPNKYAIPFVLAIAGVVAFAVTASYSARGYFATGPAPQKTIYEMSFDEAIKSLGDRAPEACGGSIINEMLVSAWLEDPVAAAKQLDRPVAATTKYLQRWDGLRKECEIRKATREGYAKGKIIANELDRIREGKSP